MKRALDDNAVSQTMPGSFWTGQPCRWFLGPLFALASLWIATMSCASAQAFPSRPLKLIVPIAAGGGADGSMRLLAEKLQPLWKAGVVVENRGGGTGAVGLTIAKNSRPDGYTVVLVTASHTALQGTRTDLPYDLLKDFVTIGQMTTTSYVLLVNPTNVGVPSFSVQ